MPESHDKKGIFYQNLIDAGCQKQDIEKYLLLYKNNENALLTKQLSIHRKSLLDALHQTQYRIDCLDYLLHQLKTK